MVNIDWTTFSLAVVAIFALAGFFKGWWKEAITTGFLVFLLLLLQNPTLAQTLVDLANSGLEFVWKLVPDSLLTTAESILGLSAGQIPAIDANSAGTWLMILMFCLVLSVLIGRSSLHLQPTALGGLLGGVLGLVNGFMVMGLIKEYLDGANLPGLEQSALVLPTEVAQNAGGTAATPGVGFVATNVPTITLMDSYLPWVLMFVGVIVVIAAVRGRVQYQKNKDGYRKIKTREPYGYKPAAKKAG